MTDPVPTLTADAPQPEPAGTDDLELRALRDGIPDLLTTPDALADEVAALVAAGGPVGVDAERASGYRYSQRAYLVQLHREGAPTGLIDPVELPELSSVGRALVDVEWVFHAASQDLPCLAEVGMTPRRIFDTELAARLAGRPRVGLGPLVAETLGVRLEKGHGAADWSTRPLPDSWLRYAALDVEVLPELRDVLAAELAAQGKLAWAEEEFAAVLAAPPPAARIDPWRRTSGLHTVRGRRGLAVVRSLWEARDGLAQRRDVAPGRTLPDASIIAAAKAMPRSRGALAALKEYSGRGTRRTLDVWWPAVEAALALPESALPPAVLPADGPPPPRSWPDRDPAAGRRLAQARAGLAALSEQWAIPVENLLPPDAVRRVLWQPPADAAEVAEALTSWGARRWQVELAGPVVAQAVADHP